MAGNEADAGSPVDDALAPRARRGSPRSGDAGAVEVPIGDLLPGDSPRLGGIDERHARMLAESIERLPPAVVHRPSMQVIDGAHRLRAASLRGDTTILVTYVDGDDADVFVAAVEANVRHGLPLSSADRQAAARRILATHGHWSDRAIASVVGLSPTTVGKIRRRSTVHGGQSTVRHSRDGRVRPVSTAEGRLLAARLIEEHPETPLRDIAAQADISVSAARRIRRRLQRDDAPTASTRRTASVFAVPEANASRARLEWEPSSSVANALRRLKADPGLMSSREARLLIQWSGIACLDQKQLHRIIEGIPTQALPDVKSLCDKVVAQYVSLDRALERKLT